MNRLRSFVNQEREQFVVLALFGACAAVLWLPQSPKFLKIVMFLTAILGYAIVNRRHLSLTSRNIVQWVTLAAMSILWLAYLSILLNEAVAALSFLGTFILVSVALGIFVHWSTLNSQEHGGRHPCILVTERHLDHAVHNSVRAVNFGPQRLNLVRSETFAPGRGRQLGDLF